MIRCRRPNSTPYLLLMALLGACSYGSTFGSGPLGPPDPSATGDESPGPGRMAVEVTVLNLTDRDASITVLEGSRSPRRQRLGEVRRGQQNVFEAGRGVRNDVRFEIALRGGGGCFCNGAVGMSQSVHLTIQVGVSRRPGMAPPPCICQLGVM